MSRTRVVMIALVSACIGALIFGGTAVGAKLITSANIKDGSIELKDLSRKAQASLKGSNGAAGANGAAGPAGAQGPAGSNATVVYSHVASSIYTVNGGDYQTWTGTCPAGATAINIQVEAFNGASYSDGYVTDSYQIDGRTDQWYVEWHNNLVGAQDVMFWVLCAK